MTHILEGGELSLDDGGGDGAEGDGASRRYDEVGHQRELTLLLATIDGTRVYVHASEDQTVLAAVGLHSNDLGVELAAALDEQQCVCRELVEYLVAGGERLAPGGARRDLESDSLVSLGHPLQNLRQDVGLDRVAVEGDPALAISGERVLDLDASRTDEVGEHIEGLT